ncbi:NAD(P)/FAD-dependent oxidoreductase [Ilumatobacter sp.]|uniref:NAD(P)/FAD-dependent oxidoreductase n=1 Tax=Ilumatobacter sp. TaxID=1967498 RepID=UPI003B51FAF0
MTRAATHHDVVCVGGAMTASSVAYWLGESEDFDGSIAVVEADTSYSSAMTTRAQNSIREQFTSPLNRSLSRFGMEFIADFHSNVEVEGVSPELNFRGTGYLFLAADDDHLGRMAHDAVEMRAAGADVSMLGPEELADRFDWLDATRVAGGRLGGPREGSFDGWALFHGMRRRAIHRGATYLDDRVVGLDVDGGRVTGVRLASGATLGCRWVVNAAGCRAPEVASMAGVELPIEPRSRTSFVFDCRRPIEGDVPLTITPDGVHFRREQRHYVCGTVPALDVAVDPSDLAARVEEFEDLVWPVLAAYVPRFDRVRVLASWGGQYDFNVIDHNLVVGASAEVDNLLLANGFSGHGLQQGPAVGRALAEWIVFGEYRTIDLSPFGVDRFARGEPILESAVI